MLILLRSSKMRDDALWKAEMAKLKVDIETERGKIESLDDLVKKQIAREPGLWEYEFDDLSAEMWRRFNTLEKNSDCLSEDQYLPPRRFPAAVVRRLHKLYRAFTLPLSRTILDKRNQFNLDQQALLNQENIPFSLAILLTLQKIKDRLNALEETVGKLRDELEDE